MIMKTKPPIEVSLEERLRLQKKLQDITNRIHAAQNIAQILIDLNAAMDVNAVIRAVGIPALSSSLAIVAPQR